MDLHGKRVILCSNSPRRQELISALCIDFEVDTNTDFEERFNPGTPFDEVPALMSRGKSLGFHRALGPDEILLTADTLVILPGTGNHPGEILGKPHGREDAVRMLQDLSGRTHHVITGVTLRSRNREVTFSDRTEVTFKGLTPEEIAFYVDTCRPYDKAGAYGVQEWIGMVGITKIEGSYFNVVGLPVHRVWEALQGFLPD